MTATINVGADPENLAYDSTKGEIFVTEGYIVQVISDKTNAVVANITMGTGPVGIAYDSGKGELFVAVFGSNVVAVISDSSTGATSSTSSSSPVSTSSTGFQSSSVQYHVIEKQQLQLQLQQFDVGLACLPWNSRGQRRHHSDSGRPSARQEE